ncbi:hypothetical protein EI94DRAFT_1703098 [Lactarius quietus]|nr:hypothetical protein EI94DRAFT_1703098 [Lactarius quietus]
MPEQDLSTKCQVFPILEPSALAPTTKKTPYAKPNATTSTTAPLSPKLLPSTMGLDTEADKGLSPAIKTKNKKATGRRGKTLTNITDPSLNTKANGDPAPVVSIKKGARCRGKTLADTSNPSSSTKANKDPAPVVNVKKGARHQGETGQASDTAVNPTHALQDRPGCNIHPAGMQKVQRSKEQVEANCEASLKAQQQKLNEIQKAKDFLAWMNILEECNEDNLSTIYPQHLSMRINKQRHIDAETESDEYFDIRVDNCSDLDSSPPPSPLPEPDRATEAKPKCQKCIKGAAHQELLSKTKALRLAERNKSQVGKSKCGASAAQLTTQDLGCWKYANSGLCQQPPTQANAAHDELGDVANPFEFGEMRPNTVDGPQAAVMVNQRDHENTSCSNEFVKVRAKSKDDFQEKPQAMCKSSKSNMMKVTVKKSLDKTRKSKLTSDTLGLVKTFFNGAKYRGQPEKIKEYVHWALQYGGQAYYETPIPHLCTLGKGDPSCPKLEGFLHLPFIIPIAKAYIKFANKSVLQPSLRPRNPPMGLYALILTAVEHAFRAYMTGAFNTPNEFNQQATWGVINDYYSKLGQVPERSWAHALTFDNCDDLIEGPADETMLHTVPTFTFLLAL